MIVTKTIDETRRAIAAAHAAGKDIGLVPTMGALHAGHASLIRAARADNDFVVVSIFVNPSQFGPNEDLSRYPRPFERDVQICQDEGVDLIFHPTPNIMYAPSFQTWVEVQELQKGLCGASRPGHFRGVATVVLKLFNIVQPHRAYFGQKDAQQARVLLQMTRDLDVPTDIKICPIVREPDGLALSSRNAYLDADQRRHATILHRALEVMRSGIDAGERRTDVLIARARTLIEATPGTRIDYIAVVDWEHLQPVERVQGKMLIALAVFLGTTRLIDNLLIEV
ncbi:MAG TPA: pantoate--beta-alanine ligase [Gemmataceae bacterium]|nr:pantoate--beta-alanine ligase [Gemmataceae bacterium]